MRMTEDRFVPLIGTVMLHLLLLGLLSFSLGSERPKPAALPVQQQAVEAVAVDSAKVQAELKKLQQKEKQRQSRLAEEERRLQTLKRKREAEQKQRRAEEKKRKAEQQRLAKLKKEQQALKKKQEAEKQRLAELEKQRKIEAEKRAREEAEKKRQAEEARKRKAGEAAFKEKLAAEQRRLEQETSSQHQAMQLEYISLVADKVRRNWLRPAGSPADFSCRLEVNQLPTGDVVSVRFIESCGNAALDKSVEHAVLKASPLPKPPEQALFDRELVFTFIP